MTILAAGSQALQHTGQINASTPALTVEHKLGDRGGIQVFNNIWLILEISTLNSTEKLDVYGQMFGASDYNTAVLVTQIDLKASDEDIIAQDVSGKGPIAKIKLVATLVASLETINYNIVCW